MLWLCVRMEFNMTKLIFSTNNLNCFEPSNSLMIEMLNVHFAARRMPFTCHSKNSWIQMTYLRLVLIDSTHMLHPNKTMATACFDDFDKRNSSHDLNIECASNIHYYHNNKRKYVTKFILFQASRFFF